MGWQSSSKQARPQGSHGRRFALVGTAPSWTLTPWHDPAVTIVSLNDAYRMKGFQRADLWFDTHPLDKFVAPPAGRPLLAHQVPAGSYLRPADHLAWLGRQAQTIPVILHPDYRTQYPEAATWPKARPFPKAEAEAHFGRYFTSSPAWILAWALLQGYRDIEVYGIHLSTEHEYIEQRPCFEFFCGKILGAGPQTLTVADGLRRYQTRDGSLVLPEASPVLASTFQYGYEARPLAKLEPLKWEIHRFTVKRDRAMRALRRAKWYERRAPINEQILAYEAEIADAQLQLQQAQLASELAGAR